MKPSSAKNKGRLLQQLVRDAILAKYPELEPDDVRSTGMGQSGLDVQLSPAARRLHPFSYECKSRASFVGYTYYDQAVSNCVPDTVPVAVVRANSRKALVMMDYNDFMRIIK